MQANEFSALVRAVERNSWTDAETRTVRPTTVPGISLVRATESGELRVKPRSPVACLVLQGAKHVIGSSERGLVKAGETSLHTVDAPSVTHIVSASPADPYLAIAVRLEPELLSSTRLEMERSEGSQPAAASVTNDQVFGAVSRLTQMLDRPSSVAVLRASLMREVHYWLLSGQHGAALRRLSAPCAHLDGIGRAVELIRSELDVSLDLPRLAGEACMSLSTFRRRFRAVTNFSPLQFQKRLRLREAKRLMLHQGFAAAPAAFAVGYCSVSQFTREYHRLFGVSPVRDIRHERLQRTPRNDGDGAV